MAEINDIAAVGAFQDDGSIPRVDVPSDKSEVIAKLDEITNKYTTGEVLSDEDRSIVASYLPAVGVQETSTSSHDALIGQGAFSFDRSIDGLDVHAEGDAGCKDSGEGRIEYWNTLRVKKTGGDVEILKMNFKFRGMGFGVGPTGAMKVLYDREFSREFEYTDSALSSFDDRYTLMQWGFYFTSECVISTNVGDIVIK